MNTPYNALYAPVERVPLGALPMSPPSASERLQAWRTRYDSLPLETRLGIPPGETRSAPIFAFIWR
jgi:hypothetical protein